MRNVLYIGVFQRYVDPLKKTPSTVQLCGEEDLSDFRWYKGTVREFMLFHCDIVVKGTEPGKNVSIPQDSQGEIYNFHVYSRSEGVSAVMIARASYPELVAHNLLRKLLDQFLTKYPAKTFSQSELAGKAFSFPELKEYIIKYQDPNQADSISKVQTELNETTQVLHKTIEQVLERGEKIDSLVQKSDSLSSQSKMFYTQAKKQNSCCSVM
ncbi:synaptobrevin [Paecilomyces variotii No. 5]|uniref:Synaptobrevin homolog YKT6 n=1 Tax=Byssochlamys spectabilis (strain No. 5 / NBRC 109023) TaxID=1356009 RepID=V5HTL1_BYSSN|nr:synaptobrevin [Paecilomyces variotii No. 5]